MGLKLMAEIGLDGSGFERGLNKVGRDAANSVKSLAVQAFGIYGVEQAIAKTVETATELVNESKRLDVTVEQLQLLRQAAKDGGTEMGTLAGAFEKLDIARAKALGGDKAALAAFAKLGVDKNALQTQTAATIFTTQMSAAVKGGNVENLAPVLKEILGKGFGEIIPVLKTDFEDLSGKMRSLGSIMDTETAVKLKALNDNFELLKNIMAAQLGPVLLTVVEGLIQFVGKVKEVGAFLGALSSKGIVKGAESLVKSGSDSAIDAVFTGKAAKIAHAFDDEFSDVLYGVKSKEADDLLAQGGDAANQVAAANKATIDALREKLAREAEELAHPKPIIKPAETGAISHAAKIQTDALVKVGNFLGGNSRTISRVDQRKINLMEQHLSELKGIKLAVGNSAGGILGLGIPLI